MEETREQEKALEQKHLDKILSLLQKRLSFAEADQQKQREANRC